MPGVPEPLNGFRRSTPVKEEFDPLEFLVRRMFPIDPRRAKEHQLTGLQAAVAQRFPQLTPEAVYRGELSKLPESEIQALVKKEVALIQAEKERECLAQAEKIENERPFNCGEALKVDYAYWAKMGTWEWDEVTALSLGRNPLVVKPRVFEDYRYRDSPFAKVYAQQRELIRRSALWSGTIITSPHDFYEWAKAYEIELPVGLVEQLELFAKPVDWKKNYQVLDKQRVELEARIKELETQLAAKPTKVEKELSTTERNTLLKILYAVAKVEYGFTPDVRGTAASDIEKAVNEVGLSIDVDTVRSWLKKSAEYCREQGAE